MDNKLKYLKSHSFRDKHGRIYYFTTYKTADGNILAVPMARRSSSIPLQTQPRNYITMLIYKSKLGN
jgi:hypothetical protein